MQRKVKLPVAVLDTLTFISKNGKKPAHLQLISLTVDDNTIHWEFRSSERHRLFGQNARAKERLPFIDEPDCWVCLSIPIVMHVGIDLLKTEFIFSVPASVSVQKNDPSAKAIFV